MKSDLIPKLKAILHGPPGTDERPSWVERNTPLLPIELSITIDGIGGIYPGNVFTADYIPKRYRKTCVFQVKSLEHTVNADGWDITITGQIRLALAKIGDAIRELEAEK